MGNWRIEYFHKAQPNLHVLPGLVPTNFPPRNPSISVGRVFKMRPERARPGRSNFQITKPLEIFENRRS
jgi:hypothetical protein